MKMTSKKETKVSELYAAAANELNEANKKAESRKDGMGANASLFGLGGG